MNDIHGVDLLNIPALSIAGAGTIVRSESWTQFETIVDILDQAKSIKKRIQTNAGNYYEKVFTEAKSAGEIAGRAEVIKQLAEVQKIRESIRKDMETELIELLILLTEKLVGEIGVEPIIKKLVVEALNASKDSPLITLRVHPTVIEYTKIEIKSWLEQHPTIKHLEVLEDESLDPAQCVVLSEVGEVRASIHNELEAIRIALSDLASSDRSENHIESTEEHI